MPGLSTLDFAQYRHGAPSERIEFAKQLIESFQNYGFVKITNHGIPDERIRQLFDFVCPQRLQYGRGVELLIYD